MAGDSPTKKDYEMGKRLVKFCRPFNRELKAMLQVDQLSMSAFYFSCNLFLNG